MEDTLVINGVTYIRQSQVAEMEQNLENIRQMVNSALNNVSALANSQLVAQSNNQVTKTVTKKKVEAPKIKRDITLKIRKTTMVPYEISRMDDSGNFYSIHNRKYVFIMRDVLLIRKEFGVNTTSDDIKKLSKKISLSENNIHRIIYNLEIGTFDKYIKEWLESVNEVKKVTEYHTPVENNPQKRKESGIYV